MVHRLLPVKLNSKKIIASCVSLVHREKGCIYVFQKVAESHHCVEYIPQMAMQEKKKGKPVSKDETCYTG